jgi:hypothetical protein
MATKRIKLTHGGTATVDENCPQEIIDALNGLSKMAFEGYVLVETERLHQQGITCLTCGRTSYNQNDIKFLYCGHCNKFHAQKST